MSASRLIRAVGILGVAATLSAFVAVTPAAGGTISGSPGSGVPVIPPNSEGPAGPPALLPNGRVASPPSTAQLAPAATTPKLPAGCLPAPYGANYYAPPFGTAKTVALTFDDGPGPSTQPIISVLRRYGVTATFFNLGQNSAAYPALVRTEATDGYLVANHTWSHPNLTTQLASAQGTQMDQATVQQQNLIGWGPCAFRPPGGNYNATTLTLAQQRGMKFWLWSVDTEDWKAAGSSSSSWVNRIISLAEKGGTQAHPVILMHNAPAGDPATVLALPTIISYYRSHGYTFVDLAGRTGLGYHVLKSNGGVANFGATWYGSAAGTLGTARAVGLAVDPDTGGYWIVKSNGGVANYHAPWYGSLAGKVPGGDRVTAIAASPQGGYLVLTAAGAVTGFHANVYGQPKGTLGTVTAVALATVPATGGYVVLKSNGGVANYNAPWYGSLTGKVPASQTVTAIAAS